MWELQMSGVETAELLKAFSQYEVSPTGIAHRSEHTIPSGGDVFWTQCAATA